MPSFVRWAHRFSLLWWWRYRWDCAAREWRNCRTREWPRWDIPNLGSCGWWWHRQVPVHPARSSHRLPPYHQRKPRVRFLPNLHPIWFRCHRYIHPYRNCCVLAFCCHVDGSLLHIIIGNARFLLDGFHIHLTSEKVILLGIPEFQ